MSIQIYDEGGQVGTELNTARVRASPQGYRLGLKVLPTQFSIAPRLLRGNKYVVLNV